MIGSKRSPHTKLAIAIPDILGGVSSVRGFSILEKGLSSAFGLRGEGFGFDTRVGVGVGADSGFSSSIEFGSSGGSGSIKIPYFSQDGSDKGSHPLSLSSRLASSRRTCPNQSLPEARL